MAELSDDALKVRRNLLITSFLATGATLADVRIAQDSPIFGFHLINLTDALIRGGLAIAVAYLVVHFAWCTLDAVGGWRIRVTGTRQGFITAGTFGNEHHDYTGDFRQSSLYNWWRQKRGFLSGLAERMPRIEAKLEEAVELIRRSEASEPIIHYGGEVTASLEHVRKEMEHLKNAIRAGVEADQSPRVVASLRRFDRWYGLWLRSQNLRWLVLDTGLPILAGTMSFILLMTHT